MNKQEEREYWTKLLSENDGAVWCDVGDGRRRWVISYVVGDTPFMCVAIRTCGENEEKTEILARYKNNDYDVFFTENATPILPKPRRPWTADEIMAHGIFAEGRSIERVLHIEGDRVHFRGRLEKTMDIDGFRQCYRAVCLELRDGILCDNGKRVELYKDGE